ncbi:MAG TPA: bifunctional DNA-formamidopyrimidine glycosylase/DNA-(apurinic or apyrimidinic site) lyase [Verrucomicrobiae bacterium]|nr:bifunctional DNA-formamidopyrimidine glycosylase/DNA-(apurinic or apyrimidinic site) lyase [Verrucomicrobiae bacterium]
MPELPEVEVLVRHLRPSLRGKTIRGVNVRRAKVLKPTSPRQFQQALLGATFTGLLRRGKYLLFQLEGGTTGKRVKLLGHLGMTGRMFLARKRERLPVHAAVVFDLGKENFIYEDPRYFGRLTLDVSAVEKLGPEPLGGDFQPAAFARALKRSRQPIKVKLLDQTVVAGVGNIYASEALFRARLSPKRAANRLNPEQIQRLWRGIREVLAGAIRRGSTVPLNFGGGKSDGLFYFGRSPEAPDFYEEELRVYDREGWPCRKCGHPIRHLTQAARSTYYCPQCQRG